MTLPELAFTVGRLLLKKKYTLAVCESCTGGMLGSLLTMIPGSSEYFEGGIIAYSNKVKERSVGVTRTALSKYGAVSEEVAIEMARGVRKKLNVDIGIGITGVAGPGGGSRRKPVGLVFVALSIAKENIVVGSTFSGSRDRIRKKACKKALILLHNKLLS